MQFQHKAGSDLNSIYTEMELVIDMELCLELRRGELLGLWWQDIDWEKKQIDIVRNRVVVNGKSVVKEPKTENSVRVIDSQIGWYRS